MGLFCLGKTAKKGGNPAPKTRTPKEDPNLRRRMWAPTVGAHIVGAVLCPHLASEMGSMFHAQGQARIKNGIKHMEEEAFVQACLFFSDFGYNASQMVL